MKETNWKLNSTIAPSTNRYISGDDYHDGIGSDDATWILTSAFIIFTMQSGFGLLESGMVSRKNEANIMVKNAVDVIYGGLAYWLFGFAFSFGINDRGNGFCGLGYFFTDADEGEMGHVFSKYFFQLSFATTATTIVSGAMAERTSLKAYTMYSFINTLTYSFPAHWIWSENGWLRKMGAVDIAGCSAVHLVGGISGLVATLILKPRVGRFDASAPPTQMASPTNVLLGTFMLWWGWLGFNCGSTFGISGMKWKLASRSKPFITLPNVLLVFLFPYVVVAYLPLQLYLLNRAAVVTINGSIGGGILGMAYSYICFKNKLNIPIFVTGILAGLVSITAICSIARPWEAMLIGAIGALLACPGCALLDRLRIDDPVGCVPTHCIAGIWGLVSVAFFAEKDILENRFSNEFGIFKGGPWRFLGVQMLMVFAVGAWAAVSTFLELLLVDKVFGLRMSIEDELMGADKVEHGIVEHEFVIPSNDDGHQQISPAEINVRDLQVSEGIDALQRNKTGDRNLWKNVRAKRKLLRPKWRKALALKSPQNGNLTSGTFVIKGSYASGTVSLNLEGAAEGEDLETHENGSVITVHGSNDLHPS